MLFACVPVNFCLLMARNGKTREIFFSFRFLVNDHFRLKVLSVLLLMLFSFDTEKKQINFAYTHNDSANLNGY